MRFHTPFLFLPRPSPHPHPPSLSLPAPLGAAGRDGRDPSPRLRGSPRGCQSWESGGECHIIARRGGRGLSPEADEPSLPPRPARGVSGQPRRRRHQQDPGRRAAETLDGRAAGCGRARPRPLRAAAAERRALTRPALPVRGFTLISLPARTHSPASRFHWGI